ncbi:hypothetical protein BH23GEM9_BH23GEM9_30320 [soil metagenome]
MEPVTTDTVVRLWWITLGIYTVVLAVVLVLLTLIVHAAKRIIDGVSAIWVVGQKIANNTIHLALLDATNRAGGQILAAAQGVAESAGAIRRHAESCPGCPACVLGGEWQR